MPVKILNDADWQRFHTGAGNFPRKVNPEGVEGRFHERGSGVGTISRFREIPLRRD